MKKRNCYRDVLKGLPILGSLKRLEQNVVATYAGYLPFEPTIECIIKPRLEASEELLQALKEKRG